MEWDLNASGRISLVSDHRGRVNLRKNRQTSESQSKKSVG